jgi:hypothetical protein
MANVATRIYSGTGAGVFGSSVNPSTTLAIFTCTFDGASGVVTPVLTSGVDFTFRNASGVLVGPIAYWYSYTVQPTAATMLLGIVLAAGPPATVTITGVAAGTHITATSNGTLFLIGPGSSLS